jgi:hypothetical protein
MPSQLSRVLRAGISEWQARPRAYAAIYREYLGVDPPVPFGKCEGGEWIRPTQIKPRSSLRAVLKRGRLRIGYVDAAPYIFRASSKQLVGIDHEVGNALTRMLSSHYPKVDREPEWVLVAGSYGDESAKFTALYAGMRDGAYDVALSGQANIGSEIATVDWLCATDLCFTNFLYTGRDQFDLGSLTSREQIVAKLKRLGPITLAYVANNPGPSTPSAENLRRDVGRNLTLMPSEGSGPLNAWVAEKACHFSVGDGIASSWLSLTQWPDATNFNVQVALDENPPQQVAGFTLPGE